MYDLIVFGATGFTGKYVVETIVTTLKAGKADKFTYAIAGRSAGKLKGILQEISDFTGEDLSGVQTILANVDDKQSLIDMASQGKVILNCVGPYRFRGKDVVEACIKAGAHCVDVSGEPEYLETVPLKCDADAREKGVYIVGSCWAGSIPADMGAIHLIRNFRGVFTQLKSTFRLTSTKLHYASWASVIQGIANAGNLKPIRKALLYDVEPKPPKPKHKIEQRKVVHYKDLVKGWCLPFPGSDRAVVRRSQNLLCRFRNQRPVQFNAYFNFGSFCATLLVVIGATIFGALVHLPFGVGIWFLLTFPRLASLGVVTHEGPSRDEMDNLEFTFTLIGKGWSHQLTEPTDQHQEMINKGKILKISGKNPAYGATSIFMLQSALTILREKDNMPGRGGVIPPGAAFANTKLIEQLEENGIQFEFSDWNI